VFYPYFKKDRAKRNHKYSIFNIQSSMNDTCPLNLLNMTKLLKPTIILAIFLCPLQLFAATLYLWTDTEGKLHITEEAPSTENRIVDTMEYEPQPVEASEPAPQSTEKRQTEQLDEETCRLARERRRIARDARTVARQAEERADKIRQRAKNLKDRVGYDDELLDDYKDDIRELESAANRAELFAAQAWIQFRKADLQAGRAEIAASPDCGF